MPNKLQELLSLLGSKFPGISVNNPLVNQSRADDEMGGYATYPTVNSNTPPVIDEQIPNNIPVETHNLKNRQNQSQMEREWEQALKDSLNKQDQGIALQNQNLLDRLQYQQDSEIDTSPIRRWLRTTYGIDAVKDYKPPESPEDRQNQDLQLEQLLQQAKETSSRNKIAALKALMEQKDKARERVSQEKFAYGVQKDFNAEMEKQVEGPARKLSKDLGQIEEALKPGPDGKISISKFNAAVTNTAKNVNSNPGALSDTDVARIDFTTMSQRAEEYLSRFADAQGRIDASRAKPFLEMVSEAKRLAGNGIKQAIDTKRLHYSNPNNPAQGVLYAGSKPYAEQRFKMAEQLVSSLSNDANAGNINEDKGFQDFLSKMKSGK